MTVKGISRPVQPSLFHVSSRPTEVNSFQVTPRFPNSTTCCSSSAPSAFLFLWPAPLIYCFSCHLLQVLSPRPFLGPFPFFLALVSFVASWRFLALFLHFGPCCRHVLLPFSFFFPEVSEIGFAASACFYGGKTLTAGPDDPARNPK